MPASPLSMRSSRSGSFSSSSNSRCRACDGSFSIPPRLLQPLRRVVHLVAQPLPLLAHSCKHLRAQRLVRARGELLLVGELRSRRLDELRLRLQLLELREERRVLVVAPLRGRHLRHEVVVARRRRHGRGPAAQKGSERSLGRRCGGEAAAAAKPAAWREEVTEADALTKRKILEAKCERVYERLLAIKKRAEAMPPPPKRAASEPPLALGAPLKKRALEVPSAA